MYRSDQIYFFCTETRANYLQYTKDNWNKLRDVVDIILDRPLDDYSFNKRFSRECIDNSNQFKTKMRANFSTLAKPAVCLLYKLIIVLFFAR